MHEMVESIFLIGHLWGGLHYPQQEDDSEGGPNNMIAIWHSSYAQSSSLCHGGGTGKQVEKFKFEPAGL